MPETLTTIPLSKLVPSVANVRKAGVSDGIEELAASIAAHGLLQNLTVRPAADRKGKPSGTYEVIAGGRRLMALRRLAKERRIAKHFPVSCRVLSKTNANGSSEISLAENVVRAPLHPADQFEAFSKLKDEGLGAEEIAHRFGIASTVVFQRLKLAAVSPRLLAEYRQGGMTLEQLVAFTISDDHAAQETVWFDLSLGDRSPRAIRRALTKALVEGSDRRARFVGVKAYEAAGGTIVRDLFQPDEDAYFADEELLHRLVQEKLSTEAEKLKAEGWAWVEVYPTVDHAHLATFGRIHQSRWPCRTRTRRNSAGSAYSTTRSWRGSPTILRRTSSRNSTAWSGRSIGYPTGRSNGGRKTRRRRERSLRSTHKESLRFFGGW